MIYFLAFDLALNHDKFGHIDTYLDAQQSVHVFFATLLQCKNICMLCPLQAVALLPVDKFQNADFDATSVHQI